MADQTADKATDKIVAFICTHNACRSQIAEALAKHTGYQGYEFCSAGSVPKEQINCFKRWHFIKSCPAYYLI